MYMYLFYMYPFYRGSTFRQSLLRIGELRSILPVMALTATASKSLRHVVSNIIGLRNPHVVAVSPCKPNIMFSVGDFDSHSAQRGHVFHTFS